MKIGTIDQLADIKSICGTKPAIVGLIDGYGLNSYSKTVKAEAESEVAKCPNVKLLYAAAQGDVQTQNADILSLAAQGANVLAVVGDAGPGQAVLPNEKKVFDQGVMVVNFDEDAGGTPGVDYLSYDDDVLAHDGQVWADWVAQALGSRGGNVVYLGGPAGATHSLEIFNAFKAEMAKHSELHLLTTTPIQTNWDVPSSQQAMSGLLAKYPKIDAVVSEIGESQEGAISAFQLAGRKLVPMVSGAQNSLSCNFATRQKSNPQYQYAGSSTRTWMVRVAIRQGLAAYEGTVDNEPSLYELPLIVNSLSSDQKLAPAATCISGAPADFDPSTQLTQQEIQKAFK